MPVVNYRITGKHARWHVQNSLFRSINFTKEQVRPEPRSIVAVFYLGPYGSDESRRRFGELIAKVASGTVFRWDFDPTKQPLAELRSQALRIED